MTTLYITRHGETEYNTENRVQGWCDSPLTKTGIINAEALACRFEKIHLDAIYTSPLGRAAVTAEIIRSGRNIPIIQEPDLKELGFGRLEEHTYAEFPELIGMEHADFFSNLGEISKNAAGIYGGENFSAFSARVTSALYRILEENDSRSVLIVSHTMPVKFIIAAATGLGGKNFGKIEKPRQASFTEIHYSKGVFRCIQIDDISHFGGAAQR